VIRKVIWSRDALDELIGIARYIAADNPRAARNVAQKIRDTGNLLGEAPTGRPGRVLGTYEKVIRGLPYIIAYSLGPTASGEETVMILRVIHGARNWPDNEWPE
jgi:toxin ParE1/3/4